MKVYWGSPAHTALAIDKLHANEVTNRAYELTNRAVEVTNRAIDLVNQLLKKAPYWTMKRHIQRRLSILNKINIVLFIILEWDEN